MGKYINSTSDGKALGTEKYNDLIKDGATPIEEPTSWQEGLVCVKDCGLWEAAAYAYDEHEMNYFKNSDGSKDYKLWLLYKHAKDLAQ